MKIKLHGTRGSYPTSNKENDYYGGRTPCIEVIAGDERLILDAGTGILGIEKDFYNDVGTVNILLTHLHMDHIQGLGFFKPIFNPNNNINIWGPGGSTNSLFFRLNRFISPPLFPVPLRDIPSDLRIREIANSTFRIGSFKITSEFVSHPGPTVGFRIEKDGNVFTYIPDHEPIIGKMQLYEGNEWLSGFGLAKESDLLIHDAQYMEKEYMIKTGWGHSSMRHAADFATRTKSKYLIMFHHDPDHTDDIKNEMFDDFMKSHDYDFKIELAVQGNEIEL